MIGLEINDAAFVEQNKVLEQALSTNPKTQKALQKLIQQVLKAARARVIQNVNFKNDPRGTKRAIRAITYKKILGGNINILDPKKRHGATGYEPPRKGSDGRGGNRRRRSSNTARIMSYDGLDREFIMRWVDAGMTKTNPRTIRFTSNPRRHVDQWNEHPNTGNRSAIQPRDFFRKNGYAALQQAADTLATLIDTELENILNKKK